MMWGTQQSHGAGEQDGNRQISISVLSVSENENGWGSWQPSAPSSCREASGEVLVLSLAGSDLAPGCPQERRMLHRRQGCSQHHELCRQHYGAEHGVAAPAQAARQEGSRGATEICICSTTPKPPGPPLPRAGLSDVMQPEERTGGRLFPSMHSKCSGMCWADHPHVPCQPAILLWFGFISHTSPHP